MGIRVVGTNVAVPRQVQTSVELAPAIGRSAEWILERTGVRARHVAAALKDPAILAAEAARPVIERHGEPDLLIYASAIPRQMLPETSLFLHRELKLVGVPSFSVNAVCLSFLTALKISESLISSGAYRRILICSAELASHGRNFAEPDSAALLGDGAAAVMVERTEDAGAGFEAYRMQTWSDGVDLAGVRGGGTLRPPDDAQITQADHLFHMEGEALLRLTVPHLKRFLDEFLQPTNLTIDEIDLVVPHQASGPGLNLLTRWGFPKERVVNIIGDHGNCVAASMPMALAIAHRDGRLERGNRILFLGTAAGVSIAAGLFRW